MSTGAFAAPICLYVPTHVDNICTVKYRAVIQPLATIMPCRAYTEAEKARAAAKRQQPRECSGCRKMLSRSTWFLHRANQCGQRRRQQAAGVAASSSHSTCAGDDAYGPARDSHQAAFNEDLEPVAHIQDRPTEPFVASSLSNVNVSSAFVSEEAAEIDFILDA